LPDKLRRKARQKTQSLSPVAGALSIFSLQLFFQLIIGSCNTFPITSFSAFLALVETELA
jgi:hypothetical protein